MKAFSKGVTPFAKVKTTSRYPVDHLTGCTKNETKSLFLTISWCMPGLAIGIALRIYQG